MIRRPHLLPARASFAIVAAAMLALLASLPAAAQGRSEEPSGPAVLTPFPENDVYRVQVYGDAFAEGLLQGLLDVLVNNARVQVQRRHKPIGALVRTEWEDDIRAEEAARDSVHIGVLMLGLQDRQTDAAAIGCAPACDRQRRVA